MTHEIRELTVEEIELAAGGTGRLDNFGIQDLMARYFTTETRSSGPTLVHEDRNAKSKT
jgi:hypothetical protein